jgi:hypothetical protein
MAGSAEKMPATPAVIVAKIPAEPNLRSAVRLVIREGPWSASFGFAITQPFCPGWEGRQLSFAYIMRIIQAML